MMTEYNELVDHLVSTMPRQSSPTNSQQMSKPEAPFDTPAYQNYKEMVDKERANQSPDLIENIYRLGYKIDTALAKIISRLDNIIKDDFNPENVKCEIDNEQVDCKEFSENVHLDLYTEYDKDPDGGIFDA